MKYFLVFALIILVAMTPSAFAQNLDMGSHLTKQFTMVDSILGQLTEKYQNSDNVSEFLSNLRVNMVVI